MAVEKSPAPTPVNTPLPWYKRWGSSTGIARTLRVQAGPLIGLVAINVVFMLLAPTYRQWPAVRDVLEQSTVLLIMATGTTMVLISGGLDLSVGSVLALACVVAGSLLLVGAPVWVAVLGALAVGTLCGFINGMVIVTPASPLLLPHWS